MIGRTCAACFLLRNRRQTEIWGRALGAQLRSGDVIALVGDLGVGKTTLTQAIARGMAIAAPVTSPTFTLVQEYAGPIPLFHFDPYRLRGSEDLIDLGFEEYFERGGAVVIEWADRIMDALPEDRLVIHLDNVDRTRGEAHHSTDADALDKYREDSENGAADEPDPEDSSRSLIVEAIGPRSTTLLALLKAASEIGPMRVSGQ